MGTHQDTRYAWSAGGNLTQRYDLVSGWTEAFSYDALDRLISASGPYAETWTYDEIGNIISRGTDDYTYGAKPHAVLSAGRVSYIYDANGNMTSRGGQAITWDVENRSRDVGPDFMLYDGDGQRIRKTEGGQTILYIGRYYEKNLSTGEVSTYYYLGDRLVAKRTGSTLTYLHQDSLGSTSVVTDSSGAKVAGSRYYPYGGTWSASGTLPAQRFTGQRLDESGLYYYNARYYDANLGRFISADTIVPSPSDPASLNRYSYVLNNPLKYSDPTGHWSLSEQLSGSWQVVLGFGDALVNTFTDIVGMLANPVETGAAIAYAATHLEETWQAIKEDYAEKASSDRGMGEIVGELLIGVATIGAGPAISGSAKAARIAGTSRFAANVARGRAFESSVLEAMNAVANTKYVTGPTRSGALGRSMPDILQAGSMTEIKDRAVISLTRQLQIQTGVAEEQGMTYNLIVSPRTTSISKRLQATVRGLDGDITVFDDASGIFTPWAG